MNRTSLRNSKRDKYPKRSRSFYDIDKDDYSEKQYSKLGSTHQENTGEDSLDNEKHSKKVDIEEIMKSAYEMRTQSHGLTKDKLHKNIFNTTSHFLKKDNHKNVRNTTADNGGVSFILDQEEIHLESRNQRISKSRKRLHTEEDMKRQKQALETQKQKEMLKYGAKPQRNASTRTSHRVHSKYNRSKAPKIPNKYSKKTAFSKSFTNLNFKYLDKRHGQVEATGGSNIIPSYSRRSKLSGMITNLKNDHQGERKVRRSSSAHFSQVSCLERIANESYSKKRVSPVSVFGRFLSDCKDQLILARRAEKAMRFKPYQGEKIRLKRNFKKLKTVLLDLDETLIHSEEWIAGQKYDIEVDIQVDDGTKDVSFP